MTDTKFKNLVHYICYYCEDEPAKLGATKLNKILWLSDVFSYVRTGCPITEERYIKLPYGPAPQTIDDALKSLQQEQHILVRNRAYPQPTLFIALDKPKLSGFSAEQISLVDSIINWVVNEHSATSISQFSHDFDAWQVASLGEEIPHYAVFSSFPGAIAQQDINWAKETINNRLGTQ